MAPFITTTFRFTEIPPRSGLYILTRTGQNLTRITFVKLKDQMMLPVFSGIPAKISSCSSCKLCAIALLAALVGGGTAAAFPHPHRQSEKAKVHFLAAEILLRGTWGMNRDTYLAELIAKPGSAPTLVRMVDEYPQLAPPLSHEALVAQAGTTLRIKRDPSCDSAYADMHLRAAAATGGRFCL